MHKIIRLLTCCFIFSSTFSYAAPEQVFAFDDDGVVWGFDFLDEKTLFVSQRSGKLHLVNLASNTSSELIAPAVKAKGQGGHAQVDAFDAECWQSHHHAHSRRQPRRAGLCQDC